jgi:hypothetical protein
MRIHGAEVVLVGEYGAAQRAHAFVQGMRRSHLWRPSAADQQAIPAFDGLREWTTSDKLGKQSKKSHGAS